MSTKLKQIQITTSNNNLIKHISKILNTSHSKLINNIIEQYSLSYLEQNSKPIIESHHNPISILKNQYQCLFRLRFSHSSTQDIKDRNNYND